LNEFRHLYGVGIFLCIAGIASVWLITDSENTIFIS
jgi:hypothetical protein